LSRTVDKSDLSSLSDEDLIYLHTRSEITTRELAEARGISESQAESQIREALLHHVPLSDRVNTGDANTAGLDADEYKRRTRVQNDLPPDEDEDEEDDEDTEEDAYDGMTNDQLRAELASRDLPVSGKQEELIRRLREDDASEEDDEE
jgi:hypothetical protein